MVDPYKSHGTLYSPPDSGKGPQVFVAALAILLFYGFIGFCMFTVFRFLFL